MNHDLLKLHNELKDELLSDILPYWLRCKDNTYGGFIGRIDGNDYRLPFANKGVIMMSRILWTFSAAYKMFNDVTYLDAAKQAKDFLLNYFIDPHFGGVYWEVDYKGSAVNTKKQAYAIGFVIYGLSEYYRAASDKDCLDTALELYRLIEKHIYDEGRNGYIEALTMDWKEIEDMRLSEKDENERFTMNTHLHILEAYTNLLEVYPDDRLRERVKNLILIFTEKIINKKSCHLGLFFDESWNEKKNIVSYGHDIEASWLLYEAAEATGDKSLIDKLKSLSSEMADAAAEGIEPDGSMIYESDKRHVDAERHWWVQAEAVTGYFYQYILTGDTKALQTSVNVWEYIKKNIIDYTNGEWVWSIYADGSVNRIEDKAGFWKCPYHNGRMCLELIGIINKI